MQCAGNRRAGLRAVTSVAGIPWGSGAIGNATWTGASPDSVLRGYKAELHPGRHVAFACADKCDLEGKRFNCSVSIPDREGDDVAEPNVQGAYCTAPIGQSL
jgi:sulfite oxidase